MNDRETKLRQSSVAAATYLPPATVEETGWDVLFALHSDRRCDLGLRKLAAMVSAPEAVLARWLATLEECGLITGARHGSTGDLLAVLTFRGRELLDRYLSATGDLQVGAHQ